jgi:hypothetical protein
MIDFTQILDDLHVPYHDSGRGTRVGWVNFQCPYCEKDPYMGYNLAGRYVNCWSCGTHDLIATLHMLGMETQEARKVIEELPRTRIYKEIDYEKRGKLVEPVGLGNLLWEHKNYLRKRNLWFYPRRYKLRGINGTGIPLLRWRIYIPIYFRGEMVSWTARTISNHINPKYWSPPDAESIIPITQLIYGVDECRATILVVEGPLDRMVLGSGAGATLGQDITPARLEQISRFPRRIFCFDNEPDAQARARRWCRELSPFPGATLNIALSSGKDPSRVNKKELQALKEEFLNPKDQFS